MKLALRQLLGPLLVLAAIVSWASWHAQQSRFADSGAKLPIEIRMRTAGRMPVVESQLASTLDQQHSRVRLKR